VKTGRKSRINKNFNIFIVENYSLKQECPQGKKPSKCRTSCLACPAV
jgi:hypothetical protein